MSNIIKLTIDKEVKLNDGREFTRVLGGFNEDSPIMTDLQVAELLGYKLGARQVRQTMLRNIDNFENELHYIDLIDKGVLDCNNNLKDVADCNNNLELLKSLGYTNMSIGKAKNIYIFSEAGFLLFLKFAEGYKAVELYKDFIEKYYKLKAENETLRSTIEEQIESLYNKRDAIYGKAIRKNDKELFIQADKIMDDIIKLEKQLTEELTVEKYKEVSEKWKQFIDTESTYTFTEVSKMISTMAEKDKSDIKISNRKLTEFLRSKGILSKNKSGDKYTNMPNKDYEDYFNVTTINVKGKFDKTQTKVKGNGIEFIYDMIKKDKEVV